MEEKKITKTIRGNFFAKAAAFIILIVGFASFVAGGIISIMFFENMNSHGSYDSNFLRDAMKPEIWNIYYSINEEKIDLANMDRVEEILDDNVKASLVTDDEKKLVWSNYRGFDTPYTYHVYCYYTSEQLSAVKDLDNREYEWIFYVDPSFPKQGTNAIYTRYSTASYILSTDYVYPIICILGAFAAVSAFIFLMYAAGHHNKKEGISPSFLGYVPFDLLTAIFSVPVLLIIALLCAISWESDWFSFIAIVALTTLLAFIGTVYCMESMTRIKLNNFWQNTIIFKLLKFLHRILKAVMRFIRDIVLELPDVIYIPIIIGIVFIFEFICVCITYYDRLWIIWFLGNIILMGAGFYCAMCFSKLKKAGRALAEGDMSYKLDTSKLFLDLKVFGEDLNSIAKGINLAVEERMKSERLKTELITNVSHDIKTPLTSIINYSELIASQDCDNEKIKEYSKVLNRQSMRLKKLLEDLMDASKAATGNIDVVMQPCEMDVMLTQAIGEYEQRFEEKDLKLIVKNPESPVIVMADGRHMWRIFDNLLNNICKYALEGSRVYLTVENKGNTALIIFRNMSKYELNISADELTERFVRGDSSRHMEGNGLGLSIAANLASLQGGRMDIVTDGDLFKVSLEFPIEKNALLIS